MTYGLVFIAAFLLGWIFGDSLLDVWARATCLVRGGHRFRRFQQTNEVWCGRCLKTVRWDEGES